jgi:hypothetical protein
MTDLLITNSELSLRLLVRLRVAVEFLYCLVILSNGLCEFDVALCVFVPWEYFRIVRKRGERLIQRFVHFLGRAFEEAPASADEHCVPRENGLVLAVFEVEANAVLCVARRVESGNFDGADVECLLV